MPGKRELIFSLLLLAVLAMSAACNCDDDDDDQTQADDDQAADDDSADDDASDDDDNMDDDTIDDDTGGDDDDDDDTTITVLSETFDEYPVDQPPPDPWVVTTALDGIVLVRADPINGGNNAEVKVPTAETEAVAVLRFNSPVELTGNLTLEFDLQVDQGEHFGFSLSNAGLGDGARFFYRLPSGTTWKDQETGTDCEVTMSDSVRHFLVLVNLPLATVTLIVDGTPSACANLPLSLADNSLSTLVFYLDNGFYGEGRVDNIVLTMSN